MGHSPRNDPTLQGANLQRGATLEARIQGCLDWYRKHRIAQIVKQPVNTIVTGRGVARVIGKGPVDWIGRWKRTPIAFDTKSTITNQFHLEKPKLKRVGKNYRMTGGQLHQAEFLLDWTATDEWNAFPPAIGFFLVHQLNEDLLYVVHGREVLEALKEGKTVKLRSKKTGLAHWPTVAPSSTLDIAQGRKPSYDFLEVVAHEIPRE